MMNATMRLIDWTLMVNGFRDALDMPDEADRIRQEILAARESGTMMNDPLTIEFPDEFAGGRAPMGNVLRSLAGPLDIGFSFTPPAPPPGGDEC